MELDFAAIQDLSCDGFHEGRIAAIATCNKVRAKRGDLAELGPKGHARRPIMEMSVPRLKCVWTAGGLIVPTRKTFSLLWFRLASTFWLCALLVLLFCGDFIPFLEIKLIVRAKSSEKRSMGEITRNPEG